VKPVAPEELAAALHSRNAGESADAYDALVIGTDSPPPHSGHTTEAGQEVLPMRSGSHMW